MEKRYFQMSTPEEQSKVVLIRSVMATGSILDRRWWIELSI